MPLRPIHVLAAAAAAWALATTAALLRAGPLSPPAGPVSSTYKTLAEVEPRIPIGPTTTPGTSTALFRISAPGSYYLTGNITGVSGKNGIEITASGVSLDLRGHTLTGIPGSLDGILLSLVTADRIAITGGTVTAWGQNGVDLTSAGRGCILQNLQAMNNSGQGFRGSSGAVVTACSAHGNTGIGFAFGESCALHACTAQNNGSNGFSVPSSTLTACAAHGNGGIGFNAGGSLTGCIAAFNAGHGFVGNGTYAGCTARFNTQSGFSLSIGSVIGCSALSNTSNGIAVFTASVVRGNTCTGNGNSGSGAGIVATGADNRLEGNNCTQNDRGIETGSAGNFIAANTCSGNTDPVSGDAPNYVLTGTQTIGPIITATGTIASTNPWANFSY